MPITIISQLDQRTTSTSYILRDTVALQVNQVVEHSVGITCDQVLYSQSYKSQTILCHISPLKAQPLRPSSITFMSICLLYTEDALGITNFSGTRNHNGMFFSTYDKDNDRSPNNNCAQVDSFQPR